MCGLIPIETQEKDQKDIGEGNGNWIGVCDKRSATDFSEQASRNVQPMTRSRVIRVNQWSVRMKDLKEIKKRTSLGRERSTAWMDGSGKVEVTFGSVVGSPAPNS